MSSGPQSKGRVRKVHERKGSKTKEKVFKLQCFFYNFTNQFKGLFCFAKPIIFFSDEATAPYFNFLNVFRRGRALDGIKLER